MSDLITETLKVPKTAWLKDLTLLKGLLKYVDDEEFHTKWAAVKRANKERLALFIESTMGVQLNPNHMYDVQVKRLSAGRVNIFKLFFFLNSANGFMNINGLYSIHRSIRSLS